MIHYYSIISQRPSINFACQWRLLSSADKLSKQFGSRSGPTIQDPNALAQKEVSNNVISREKNGNNKKNGRRQKNISNMQSVHIMLLLRKRNGDLIGICCLLLDSILNACGFRNNFDIANDASKGKLYKAH